MGAAWVHGNGAPPPGQDRFPRRHRAGGGMDPGFRRDDKENRDDDENQATALPSPSSRRKPGSTVPTPGRVGRSSPFPPPCCRSPGCDNLRPWTGQRERRQMIGEREIRHYQEQGYIVVPNLLDEATVALLRERTDFYLESARGKPTSDAVHDIEDSHR